MGKKERSSETKRYPYCVIGGLPLSLEPYIFSIAQLSTFVTDFFFFNLRAIDHCGSLNSKTQQPSRRLVRCSPSLLYSLEPSLLAPLQETNTLLEPPRAVPGPPFTLTPQEQDKSRGSKRGRAQATSPKTPTSRPIGTRWQRSPGCSS